MAKRCLFNVDNNADNRKPSQLVILHAVILQVYLKDLYKRGTCKSNTFLLFYFTVTKLKNSLIKIFSQYSHRSLTDDRFNKNVTKKCRWVIVGFFSYITNLLRAKSDLLGLSSYIHFSISHVNFHLRNWSVFGFFAFIWMH